jgi:hypothetical protein
MSVEPLDAILACHTKIDQRPAVFYPRFPARFHAGHLVQRYPKPHFSIPTLWKAPTTLSASEGSDPSIDGRDLIMIGALPTQHSLLTVLCDREKRDIYKSVPRNRAALLKIRPYITIGHSDQRIWKLLLKPIQMTVYIIRFPPGVSEDCHIWYGITVFD